MITLKIFFVILAASLFAIAGLIRFPTPFNTDNSETINNKNALIQSIENETEFSKEFYDYEYLIQNKKISTISVEAEINKLPNEFERDYLLGLLDKRNKDFITAYHLLEKHLGSFPAIFRYYDELVQLANITGNLNGLSVNLETLKLNKNIYYGYLSGILEFTKGNYDNSITYLLTLLNEKSEEPEIYYTLAYAYRGIGDYEQGMVVLKKAEAMLDSNSKYLPKILNAEGSLNFLSGVYDAANEKFQQAYNTALRAGNVIEEIRAIANLAIIKDLYGEVQEARKEYGRGLQMAKTIVNHDLIAYLYSELGVSFTYTNNIVEARKNYEESYRIYSLLNNNERLSYLSSNIASVYLQQTNYKSALKYYNEGLVFAGENKLGQILNITGIADVYSNESNYAKALEFYKRAMQLADSIKDVSSIIKINEGLGALFYNINRPYKSLYYLEEARKKADADKFPYVTTDLLYKIGTVLSSIDSFDTAEKYLTEGVRISKNTGDVYNELVLNTELAHLYYKMGETGKAKILLKSVKTISEEYELTQLVSVQDLYLGKVYEKENVNSAAIEKYKSSFNLSEDAGDFNTQIEAGFMLAGIYEKNNDLAYAEEWYLKTVELIERISFPLVLNQEIQISHFAGFSEIFNSLIEFYLKQGRDKEAFEVVEKSRSRNTMLNLDKLKLVTKVKDEEKFNKYIDLEWMISSGLYDGKILDSLKEEGEKLLGYFRQSNKDPDYSPEEKHWRSVKDIQDHLDEKENVISVFVSDKFIRLFLLTKNNLSSVNIEIGRDSLISLLQAVAPLYRSDLVNEDIYINQDLFSFNAKSSFNLYELVFKKVLDKISANETLIFSFPPEILLLPAEFLITDWKEGDSPYLYSNKSFLIEKYPVCYTPSASIYITQKEKETWSQGQNLLVGNPHITNDDFSISYRSGLLEDDNFSTRNITLFPLEYSEAEIDNIDNIVSDNIVLLSDQATETNFKNEASGSRIIHLSTHSLLYKNQPLIIFSPQEHSEDDGYLELGEIVQLNLHSDLIVLSSCRSGLGKIDEAEGILGMQKAFFEAGAGSIIVSLWDVSDKYTSYFMKELYDALSDGLSKPESLRRAKLNFIKKYSANPYYWSAFILSGNPSKINLLKSSSDHWLTYLLIFICGVFLLSILYIKQKNKH